MPYSFPTLPSGSLPDSSKFSATPEDPSMRAEMEGGYTISRARHTRKPRRSFKVGYTSITGADKETLDDFWDSVKGGSSVFDWRNPENGITYVVRFNGKIEFQYVGMGSTKLWDCSFELEQA